MGRTFLPSISLALTCYSDSRVRNVSLKRISSDQFRLLQAGSMDVSRDQEQDRTHLRDLLTCSVRSAEHGKGGRKAGEFSDLEKYQERGFGHVIQLQFRDTPFKKLRKTASRIPSTPKPSARQHPGFAECGSSPKVQSRCSDADQLFRFREGTTYPVKMVLDYFKFLK